MPSKAPAGHFTILYFAGATDVTHKSSEYLAAPLEVSKLFATLETKYSGITAKVLNSSAVALNMEYIDIEPESPGKTSTMIQEGDEVAIIPPVSSG